jgi:hypothetical protein
LHDGRSLVLRDGDGGQLLVTCWGGCDRLDVLAELRRRRLLGGRADYAPRIISPPTCHDDASRTSLALKIWRNTEPAAGALVEIYLRSRGVDLPTPDALRYHSGLKHPSGGIWPAMVALVTNGVDRTPLAIHRTFLNRDGNGKAPVDPQKMMLGPCHGGVVRLGEPKDLLLIGEGIETCVAVMQASGHAAWAALSTSGLRALDLPRHLRDIVVLADGDDAGEAAAQDCARRWKREGRRVRIARPPQGMDFNDMLPGRGPSIERTRNERRG